MPLGPGRSAGAEQAPELGRGRRPSRPGLAQCLAGRLQQALYLGALDRLDLDLAPPHRLGTRFVEPGFVESSEVIHSGF